MDIMLIIVMVYVLFVEFWIVSTVKMEPLVINAMKDFSYNLNNVTNARI